MPISDNERKRIEAVVDAVYEKACLAGREALREPLKTQLKPKWFKL